MRIGNVEINGNTLLAPIAGWTDVVFRLLARRFGASLTYTEMVSAKGLMYGSDKTEDLLVTLDDEKPCAVQIFGKEANIMADAVKRLAKFDVIDINMGCPVPKINKNGEGCALMADPKLVYKIVNACVKAADKRAVTVKMRTGLSEDKINVFEVARACEDAGAAAITVHGRTREQMYSGRADWDIIGKVKASVNVVVIGNGDIETREDYLTALRYGVDGVMIARGALGRPQIFSELIGAPVTVRGDIILEHIDIMSKYFNERYVVGNMKKHFARYIKGMRDNRFIKERIYSSDTIDELKEIVYEFDLIDKKL